MEHGDYIVVEPLTDIDWRLATPYKDSGIAIWISETVRIIFNQFTNGQKNFVLATNIMQSQNRADFENEIGIRYSEKRVQQAIHSTDQYAFFTSEEIARLDAIFKENKFIAKEVYIESTNNGRNLLEFDEGEYEIGLRALRDYGAVRFIPLTLDLDYDEETMRQEMYNAAKENIKRQIPWFGDKQRHLSKKKVKRIITWTLGLFGSGVLAQSFGKKLIGKGIPATIAGALLYTAGAIANMLAFKTGNTIVAKLNEEVIFG